MSAAPSRSGYAQPLDDNYSCGLFLPLSARSRRSRRSRERSVGCVLLVFRERRMFSQSSVDGKLPLSFAPEILTSRGQRTWICKTVLPSLSALLLSHLFWLVTQMKRIAIYGCVWCNHVTRELFDNASRRFATIYGILIDREILSRSKIESGFTVLLIRWIRRHRSFAMADTRRDKRKLHARRKSKCASRRYDGGYEPRLCPRAYWTFDSTKYTPMIRRTFFCDSENAAGGRQRRLYLNANSEVGRESLIFFSAYLSQHCSVTWNIALNSWCLEYDVIFMCYKRSTDLYSACIVCKQLIDNGRDNQEKCFNFMMKCFNL